MEERQQIFFLKGKIKYLYCLVVHRLAIQLQFCVRLPLPVAGSIQIHDALLISPPPQHPCTRVTLQSAFQIATTSLFLLRLSHVQTSCHDACLLENIVTAVWVAFRHLWRYHPCERPRGQTGFSCDNQESASELGGLRKEKDKVLRTDLDAQHVA